MPTSTPAELVEITAHAPPPQRAQTQAALWATGAQGVQELEDGGLRIWLAADADLPGLRAHLEGLGARVTVRAVANTWAEAPQATPIGVGYAVGPAEAAPLPRRALIALHGGLGFGHDGHHPTTRVAFALLEAWLHREPPTRFLDLGAGAGLLAILAARHGAATTAVDIDSTARQACRANAALNAVPLTVLDRLPAGPFEGAAANIRADVLLSLLPTLAARVAPGGWLILAGFRAAHSAQVAAHLPEWTRCDQTDEDGWLGWAVRRPRPG